MTNYYRKIIRITAEDSPNVRYGLAEEQAGLEPSNKIIIPGVLPYADYKKRRKVWDEMRQCIGLDALFYEGAEIMFFPREWLLLSERNAVLLENRQRKARTIGIDPAEGGDYTAYCIVDDYGIIDLIRKKTPDTNAIFEDVTTYMHYYGVRAHDVYIDRGGGGKQHADRLRASGYKVKTVAFGEPATREMRTGMTPLDQRIHEREESYVYASRRVEMYAILRELLNPAFGHNFAIPKRLMDLYLRQELKPVPFTYGPEGRLILPPKRNLSKDAKNPSLIDLIGHSPDCSDALVLATYGMMKRRYKATAGVTFSKS